MRGCVLYRALGQVPDEHHPGLPASGAGQELTAEPEGSIFGAALERARRVGRVAECTASRRVLRAGLAVRQSVAGDARTAPSNLCAADPLVGVPAPVVEAGT